jgi:hypothetical protein
MTTHLRVYRITDMHVVVAFVNGYRQYGNIRVYRRCSMIADSLATKVVWADAEKGLTPFALMACSLALPRPSKDESLNKAILFAIGHIARTIGGSGGQ